VSTSREGNAVLRGHVVLRRHFEEEGERVAAGEPAAGRELAVQEHQSAGGERGVAREDRGDFHD
jgi:hypothetical protein